MRTRSAWLISILLAVGPLTATTLQKLSLDDMIRQSTGIVRAKVTGSRSALRGANIYTYYRLQVAEALKNQASNTLEVAVPGGTVNGVRQMAIGSPELANGSEYVLFLWTGKSGLTQIIGLSQGLFLTATDSSGKIHLSRPAPDEPMLDQNGRVVPAQPISVEWSELRARIRRELAK